ncbi:MAG TPA: hypothetical protein DCL68_00385 [Gammaproteobacteria bacterium]|nr:hypothetical protein [Gammaproteobacteria bacterium]
MASRENQTHHLINKHTSIFFYPYSFVVIWVYISHFHQLKYKRKNAG